MQMERGLDTGAMLAKRETGVDGKTAGALTAELAAIGAALIAEVLASLDDYTPVPQPEEGATYAAKIAKAEARLDFTAPAATVERQIRAFNPAPGAWFEYAGERIRIHAAELVEARHAPGEVLDERLTIGCGGGALRPTAVQRAGRGILSAQELLRGFPIPAGTRLA
jgi:methionyl-tRNA formyltransferase